MGLVGRRPVSGSRPVPDGERGLAGRSRGGGTRSVLAAGDRRPRAGSVRELGLADRRLVEWVRELGRRAPVDGRRRVGARELRTSVEALVAGTRRCVGVQRVLGRRCVHGSQGQRSRGRRNGPEHRGPSGDDRRPGSLSKPFETKKKKKIESQSSTHSLDIQTTDLKTEEKSSQVKRCHWCY